MLAVAVLIAFYTAYGEIPLYFVYPVMIGYDVLYVLKEDFELPVMGAVIYLFGEAIIIVIYTLSIFGQN